MRRRRSWELDRGWPAYVPVAERRRLAEREVATIAKKGREISPVRIEGRSIATTFWGNSWCENLERYSDYSNRLPRGRTYVRNGSVVDLQIAKGKVTALVRGSEMYSIAITIKPLTADRWRALTRECAGKIDSVIELLQGKISHGVMEVMTRRQSGLFPAADEISLRCSCPDSATLCKHVAATLYGVGARLDARPELLFVLRDVDHNDLISATGALDTGAAARGASVLAGADLADMFGIDLGDTTEAVNAPPTKPKGTAVARGKVAARTAEARPTPHTVSPKKQTRIRAGVRVRAAELTARGAPHALIQRWLRSGVLLRTTERGVYWTTVGTERALRDQTSVEAARAASTTMG